MFFGMKLEKNITFRTFMRSLLLFPAYEVTCYARMNDALLWRIAGGVVFVCERECTILFGGKD